MKIVPANSRPDLYDELRELVSNIFNKKWSDQVIEASMNNQITNIFIGTDYDGSLIGMIGLTDEGLNKESYGPWIGGLCINPKYRGKGYSSDLVKFIINKTKEYGYPELYLHTTLPDEFYNKFGFKLISKINGEYPGKIFKLILPKELNESLAKSLINKIKGMK